MSRIADAAGEHAASITYHYGNKAGLIAALSDSLVRDITASGLAELDRLEPGDKRSRATIKIHERVAADSQSNLAFLEIMTQGFRDPEIAELLSDAYESYRRVHREQLGGCAAADDEGSVWPLDILTLAVLDGLAIQIMLDRKSTDWSAVFRYWEEIVVELMHKTKVGREQTASRVDSTRPNPEYADKDGASL